MSLVTVKSSDEKFKDSILELQEIFSHFDKLGSEGTSGGITIEKLSEALRESLGLSFTDDELSDMIAAVDLNASGDIQFNEFLKMMDQARHDAELLNPVNENDEHAADEDEEAALARKEEMEARKAAEAERALELEAEYVMTREDIKAIFQKFDQDKDGFVSFAELKAMLQQHDEKYTDEEVHAMIHLVDPSNSGMMSYQSFVRLMLQPDD